MPFSTRATARAGCTTWPELRWAMAALSSTLRGSSRSGSIPSIAERAQAGVSRGANTIIRPRSLGSIQPAAPFPPRASPALLFSAGYGYLSRRYGIVCDNLLSADVVTASGDLVTASADSHPGLSWALRGGGGNFGAATSLEFQPHPVRKPLGRLIVFALNMPKIILQIFRDLSLESSDNLATMVAMIRVCGRWKVCRGASQRYRKGRRGRTRRSSLSRVGISSEHTFAPMEYCTMQRRD